MNIIIKNKNRYNGKGEFIGRPTPLSNKYKITETQSREEVIKKYAIWLKKEISKNTPEIIKSLNNLFSILIDNQKLILICYCKPKLCHGDVIKSVLLNKYYHGTWLVNNEIGILKI